MHHLMNRFAIVLAFSTSSVFATELADVSILAQSLGKEDVIENVEIFDVIQKRALNDLPMIEGYYRFHYPADQAISLLFKREGFATSQSGVFVMPSDEGGMQQSHISWQAIPDWLWESARYVIERHTSEKMKPGYCQLITTVKSRNEGLSQAQHSEFGTKVSLTSDDWRERRKPHGTVFYFGSLEGKPLPIPGMDEVNTEGGVVIMNIEPGHVYKITSSAPGIEFNTPYFACNPSVWAEFAPNETMLINLIPSPDHVVMAEEDRTPEM